MIRDSDRSKYIGASATDRVMLSWNTATFTQWWQEKQGLRKRTFTNDAMLTGNGMEHRILDSIGIPYLRHDDQKIIGRLRVNLDGYDGETVYECKTHRHKPGEHWKPPKKYFRQVQSQMYAFGAKQAVIVAYALAPEDYLNWYLPIDSERLSFFLVKPDEEFLKEYLPRLHYLEDCLIKGSFPNEKEFRSGAANEKNN